MSAPPPEVLQELEESLDAYAADMIQALEEHFGFSPKRSRRPSPPTMTSS
jgi:hypothetical protein